jgi:PAS domain S-box-containing protein
MKLTDLSQFRLTELYWRVIILILSGAVILFTIWCLSNGITTIFMHLYYFPIVLLAYRYRWKGLGLATLLALAYLGLVIIFNPGQGDVILGAVYRVLVFVGIAAVIAYLSARLAIETRVAQESAEIRERYISLAPAIILVLDRDGTITYLNPKGGEILACTPDEVIGKVWTDRFLPKREQERVKQVISQLMDGQVEQNRVVESPVLTYGGMEKSIRWSNTALRDENGSITGILSFGEDITGEKLRQDTLREMQQFQESVIANANVWISVLAPDGSLLVWNDAAEAISGYKKTGVLGKRTIWKQLYPDNDYRKKVTGEIQRIIGRDTLLDNFETEIRCADGTIKTMVWNTRGQRDTDGVITSYIAIGRDVTAQKSAEFRAGESSRFLAAMINSLPLPVFFKDAEGRYLGCNPPFEQYIGITSDNLIGKTAYDIAPPDLADRYTAADREIFDNPIPQKYEIQIQYADGSRHDVIFYKAPFFNTDGSVGGLIGAYLDITERKRTEEELRLSNVILATQQETSPDGILIVDTSGNIISFNKRFTELWGVPQAIVDSRVDEAVLSFVAGRVQDPHQFLARVRYLYEHQEEKSQEEIQLKDGKVFDRYSAPMLGEDGRYFGRVWYFHDITQRKRAENEHWESEIRFTELFETVSSGVAIYEVVNDGLSGKDYIIKNFNKTALAIEGKKKEEVVGRSLYDLRPSIDDYGLIPIFRDVWKTGNPAFYPATVYVDEKYSNYYENRVFRLPGGEIVAIYNDVTEQKRAELAMRESKTLIEAVVENVPLMIFLKEATDLRFVLFNRAGEELLGYDRQALLGRNDMDLFPPEQAANFMEKDREVLDGEAGMLDIPEEPIMTAQKGLRLLHTQKVSIRGADGRSKFLLGISEDITDRKAAEEAIRSREEQFRAIFQTQQTGLMIFLKEATDLRFVLFNRAGEELLGYDRQALLGRNDMDLFPPEQAANFMEKDREVLDGEAGMLDIPEEPIMTAQKGLRLLHTQKVSIRGADGRSKFLLGISEDITDRKAAEEAIRSREEQFRAIFQTQQTGLMMVDAETHTITDANPAALSMIGASRAEVIGKVCHSFVCPAEVGKCPVSDLNQTVDNSERVLIRANSERVPILKSVSPVKIGGRRFLIESFIDLSERKQMEKQISESRQLFADIISFLPDPTFVIDRDGKVLAWNRALELLSGVSADDIIGRGDHEYSIWLYGKRRPVLINLVLHKDEDAGRLNYNDIHWEGRTVTAQIEITRPGSGKKTTLSLVSSPLIDPQGKVTGAIESMRDISRLKDTEAELARINQNLEKIVMERTKELEDEISVRKQTEAAIHASLDEKVILLREIHHRVKNNLQIIISLTNLQMRQAKDPGVKEIMAETQSRVRAMALVHEKLYGSKSLSSIDFADYTRFLATQHLSYYGPGTKKVHLDFVMDEIMVDINTAVPLGLVMNELISNALKHGFPNGKEGTISLRGRDDGNLITIVVKDDGIGIPADFDWKNTTSLGMRLIISLVDQLNGTIDMDTGEGTTFRIQIPKNSAL